MRRAGVLLDALDVIFPSCCLVCGRRLKCGPVCLRCLPPIPRYFSSRCRTCFLPTTELDLDGRCLNCRYAARIFGTTRYIWDYRSQAQAFIAAMKYRPSMRLCRHAAALLAAASLSLYAVPPPWEVVAAVPSSPASLRFRGFNQAALLARAVQRTWQGRLPQLTLGLTALEHRGCKAPQASLSADQRAANVKHAFRAREKVVRDKYVLLVDDVVTTGATAKACAASLYQAGASRVDLLTLAAA